MTYHRRKDSLGQSSNLDPNKIARIVFEDGAAAGISDRAFLEQVASEVIQRLERRERIKPLPGMEPFVPQAKKKKEPPLSDSEIENLVREILAGKDKKAMSPSSLSSSPGRLEQITPALTPNAITVLERRYLIKDNQGKVIETPDGMFRRVARYIARAELLYNPSADVKAWEEKFYQAMVMLDFLPNSPTLMNADRELGQLSACFVLPVEDSMESIFNAVKHTALIHKSGGGTGFSFSRLRPEKDKVGSTGGVASGPVSFIRAFDTATDVIKQGGMRRGANMAILNVEHPDIMKFITAKEDQTSLSNFNLSVAVTAEFMRAVQQGEDYNLINPRSKEVVGKLNAREVFDKIVDLAWKTGDPGIIFIDRINKHNPTPHLGAIESTNPCGEQPLLPYESCNLGSINLSHMLKEEDGSFVVDWDKLAATVKMSVRFLDNVIDMNKFPLPEIRERTLATRKIGLGVMGFADMLIRMRIPYDSEDALSLAGRLMRFISEHATAASVELAKERGVFPAFAGSVYDKPDGLRVRNATCTTIAPTGSLSIIAGCSSGIEPLFALSYVRHILDNDQLVEVNPYFEEVAKEEGFYSKELMQELAQGKHLKDIEGVPDWVKRVFVTAHDITPEWHVKMQAAFQKYTDNAVSKTVNFPFEATREDVARVYLMAYEEGLKGITIYRDRCRDQQVLTTGKGPAEKEKTGGLVPRKRPKTTKGVTEKVTTGCGNIYVTVNFDEEGICEVFASLGKAGGCASAQLEAIARLISLALRSGIDTASIVKNLKGIRCPSIAWEEGHAILSCADAIGSVLEKHCQAAGTDADEEKSAKKYDPPRNTAGQCPECGSLLIFQEGCHHCQSCGYTRC
jgi:ribonucleoside-diphosphate reductase alpha chain